MTPEEAMERLQIVLAHAWMVRTFLKHSEEVQGDPEMLEVHRMIFDYCRAVEPASCPSLTRGVYAYDFGDTAGMTPLLKMHTLGHRFIPDPIHAGGLRYHGDAPIISSLVRCGRMEALAYPQGKTFEAAVQFANTEGKVPAPETGHAIRAVVDEALAAKEAGEERVILFDYSGHGLLDLSAYDDYRHGRLVDA